MLHACLKNQHYMESPRSVPSLSSSQPRSPTQDYICSGLWMPGWLSLGKYFLGWYCVFRAPGAVFSKQSLSNELKPLNSWFHNELDLDSFWDDLMSTFSFVPVQSTCLFIMALISLMVLSAWSVTFNSLIPGHNVQCSNLSVLFNTPPNSYDKLE